MKRFKALTALLLLLLFLVPTPAQADDWYETDSGYFTVSSEDGQEIFTRGSAVDVDDEYISGDNQLYRVISVDTAAHTAVAKLIGPEEMPNMDWLRMTSTVTVSGTNGQKAGGTRKIAMYATHSDESYEPNDGTASKENGKGGIYDVADELKAELEKLGIEVTLDKTTHLPHDAGAYRRSRQTATTLLKTGPDAMLDIHRDGGVPAGQYNASIDGENASKVRLLVGRGNQNGAANREFAKQLKAVADEQYPGLVKDIYIGKGSYNQDLMPQAVLLEMGTNGSNKDRVLNSTAFMANVISTTLYGGVSGAAGGEGNTANKQGAANTKNNAAAKSNSGVGSGIVWIVVIAVVAVALFALAATGGGKSMMTKLKRNATEMTGGLIGKSAKDDDRDKDGAK